MKRILNRRTAYLACTALLIASAVSFPQWVSGQPVLDADTLASPSNVTPLPANFSYNWGDYTNHSARKAYSIGTRLSANNNLVLRFEVRPGDRASFDPETKDRSEATDLVTFPKSEVIWNAYRVKIADGFSIPSDKHSWFIVGQWHGSKNDKRPPYIAAEVYGTDLVFRRRYILNGKPTSSEVYRMHNVPRGTWLNIVMEHKVSATDGLLNIWLNGRQVVNFNGPLGYWDHDEAGYWKFGIYRSHEDVDAVVEYRDVVTTAENLTKRAMATN